MRARVLVGVLLVALGLTAYSDDDETPPRTLPTVSATPTESAEGEVPEEAQAATPEGAAEFVRFFYAQLEAAYAAQDPERIRGLVDDECEACSRIIESLERLRSERLRVEDHAIEVKEVATPGSQDSDEVSVTAVLRFSRYVERDSGGAEIYSEPAAEQVVQDVELRRHQGSWVVTRVVES